MSEGEEKWKETRKVGKSYFVIGSKSLCRLSAYRYAELQTTSTAAAHIMAAHSISGM